MGEIKHEETEIIVDVDKNITVFTEQFKHRCFEDRLADYGRKISICEYDFGAPLGKEIMWVRRATGYGTKWHVLGLYRIW